MNHLDKEVLEHFKQDEKWQKHFSDDIKSMQQNHEEMMEKLDAFILHAEPMIRYFDGLTFSKKFILGFIGFVAAILGLVLMIKQIFK